LRICQVFFKKLLDKTQMRPYNVYITKTQKLKIYEVKD